MKYYFVLLAIALVAESIESNQEANLPTISNCENECFSSSNSYHYKYEIDAETAVPSTSDKKTGFIIKCDVQLDAYEKCQYSLQVNKCTLMEATKTQEHLKSTEFSSAVKRHSVKFSMSRGAVEGLLAHEDEPINILNFKRGIISALLIRKIDTESFEDKKRTDVQGIYLAYYWQGRNHTEGDLHMRKHLSKRHSPSRVDWPYNPMSLIWNTSAIHSELINTEAKCAYKFNSNGNLQITECLEKHAVRMDYPGHYPDAVYTNIIQTLILDKETVLNPAAYDKKQYRLTGIQFEYEPTAKPKQNPPKLKEKVLALFDKLPTKPDRIINRQTVDVFEELLELLRKSTDLSVMGEEFPTCWPSSGCSESAKEKEILVGQVWRNALVQCNRAPCTRALRTMLTWDPDYVKHVLSDTVLNSIFQAWTLAKISDTEILKEILEIAKLKPDNRLLRTALSSIAHIYWELNHNDVTKIPRDVVAFVTAPLTDQCLPSANYQYVDVMATLQSIANMGILYETVKPDYLNLFRKCIFAKEPHLAMNVHVLQATRRMRATNDLCNFLLDAMTIPDLKHEDNVVAYLLAAEKFGNSKLVGEVLYHLHLFERTGKNYNLRTFIITHMRAVAKSKDPSRATFAKAIQEAMIKRPNSFRAIPEVDVKVPWGGLHVDDGLIFDEGHFSKYEEGGFKFDFDYLPASIKSFGYQYAISTVHNGESFLPYGIWVEEKLQFLDRSFNLSHFSVISKGITQMAQKLAYYAYETDPDNTFSVANMRTAFQQLQYELMGQGEEETSTLNLPYNIDKKILQSLAQLQKYYDKKHPPTTSQKDYVIQLGFLDEFRAVITSEDIKTFFAKLVVKYTNNEESSIYISNSNYFKILEASHQIPTSAGLPLSWTTDAYLIDNRRFKLDGTMIDENRSTKFEGSFSGLASFKQGVELNLPGFTNFGAQSVSTASTSIGATVDQCLNGADKKFKVQLEFPQRQMQLLSLHRTNSLLQDYDVVDIPDDAAHRVKETWCSYKPVSPLGFKLCHSKSYVNVTGRSYKPCYLTAGNSHWEYYTEYVAKHKVANQFEVQVAVEEADSGAPTKKLEAYIKSRDVNDADKFNTMLKFSHKVKAFEFQTLITSPLLPTFNIKANHEPLGERGYHFTYEATLYPGKTTYIDLLDRPSTEMKSETTMKNHISKVPSDEKVSVQIREIRLNYTTADDYYGYSHKSQQFPTTIYTDCEFKYKSLNSDQEPWPTGDIWEDSRTAWVKFHREATVENAPNAPIDLIHRSYNKLELPQTLIKLQHSRGVVSPTSCAYSFNITKEHPPTKKLLTYINVTVSTDHPIDENTEHKFFNVNVSVPMLSWAAEWVTADETPRSTNMTLTLRKESLRYRPDIWGIEPDWRTPNTDIFTSTISSIQASVSSINLNKPEWKLHISQLSRYNRILSTLVALASKEFYSNLLYSRDETREGPTFEIDFSTVPTELSRDGIHKRDFSLRIPTENFRYDAKLNLDFSLETELLLWKATAVMPDEEKYYYTFNISSPPASGFVYVTEDLSSSVYKRNSHLTASYLNDWWNPNIQLSITASSPVDPVLRMDLQLKIADGRETMKLKHEFMDIDVDSSFNLKPDKDKSVQRYFKRRVNVKSKIGDNLLMKVDYPDVDKGTVMELRFLDIDEVFYMFANQKLNATRLVFDVCYKQNCTASDVDYFVSETEFSLEDPQMLTRTITYSPKQMILIAQFVIRRAEKMGEGLSRYFVNNPSRKDSPILKSVIYLNEAAKKSAREMLSFFLESVSKIAEAPVEVALSGIETVFNVLRYLRGRFPPKGSSGCGHLIFGRFTYKLLADNLRNPELDRLRTDVSTIPLPVYWTQFNKYPEQLSPSFRRKLDGMLSYTASYPVSVFHDEDYTRQALLFGKGGIRTFEGKTIHLQTLLQDGCSYLLSHDGADKTFTIYYKDTHVHFLFPDLSVDMSPTGQLLINETLSLDLPFESWNRNIRITRLEHLIFLNTPYGLKVICGVKPFYCVFYIDEFKFNQLLGLLGNNNDNPLDEYKAPSGYELSGAASCLKTKSGSPIKSEDGETAFNWNWPKELYTFDSSTLPCQDIVSLRGFFFQDDDYYSHGLPCSMFSGYLALCAAKGVAVKDNPCINCDGSVLMDAKIENEVEAIFTIDESYRTPTSRKQFISNVGKIAQHITRCGYNASFGLVGFRNNRMHEPQQHTMNGDLMGSLDEFLIFGLDSLEFNGPTDHNASASAEAIAFAAEHYPLRSKSAHLHILLTAEDPDAAIFASARSVAPSLNAETDRVHVFADYPSLKAKGNFGMRGDGHVFSEPKSDAKSTGYPKGPLAALSNSSRGSIWQMSFLEDGEIPEAYLEAFALQICDEMKKAALKCNQCRCFTNSVGQQTAYCNYVPCPV